ncbi:MAG: HEAT repeat domain-containing protein [archaeon]
MPRKLPTSRTSRLVKPMGNLLDAKRVFKKLRKKAVLARNLMGSVEAAERTLIADPNPRKRSSAALNLVDLNSVQSIPALKKSLATDADDHVKLCAACGLQQLAGIKALPALKQALQTALETRAEAKGSIFRNHLINRLRDIIDEIIRES